MSTYYEFYLAEKNENDQYRIVGPAKYKGGDFQIYPALVRSRSFINWEDWEYIMDKVCLDEIDPEEKNFKRMALDMSWTSEQDFRSVSYVCPYSKLVSISSEGNAGLFVGYVPKSDAKRIIENNYYVEDCFDVDYMSAEIVAEMQPEERSQYVKMAYRVTNSAAYIANDIIAAVHEAVDFEEEDYYIVCVVG